jgi:hypothetical protein
MDSPPWAFFYSQVPTKPGCVKVVDLTTAGGIKRLSYWNLALPLEQMDVIKGEFCREKEHQRLKLPDGPE